MTATDEWRHSAFSSKKQNVPNRQGGYVLVTVMVAAFLVAGLAYLLSQSSATGARMAAADLERDAARYVAEAGLQHGLWLAQQADCSNYASLVSEPFGDHSYTVTPTPTDGSPIVFQSSALLSSGSGVTLTSLPARVYATSSTATLVLQPGTPGTDTYIRDGGNDDNNFGAAGVLKLNNQSAEEASLLKFDLSSIPVGAGIYSATLELWLEGGDSLIDGVIDAHRVTQAWVEGNRDGEEPVPGTGATYNSYNGQTNWANEGGDYAATPVDTTTIPTLAQGWHQWDITTVMQDWVSSATVNNGILLRASAGNVGKIKFTSSDGNAAERPKLTVIYECECGQPCTSGITATTFVLSTEGNTELGGLSFTDKDLAEYDPSSDTATLFFDGGSGGAALAYDIDAVHVMANGHIVLSAINTITLGGVTAENEDLISYDPVNDVGTLYFDGSALFTSGSTDISAVHVLDNGHLLLTNEYSATIGGLSFDPNDIVKYDPATDSASMVLDGSTVGLSAWIDAVHLLDNGNIILSTNTSGSLGGLSFDDGDLIEYDLVNDTATLFFDEANFSTDENVRSVHVGGGAGGEPPPTVPGKLLFVVGNTGGPGMTAEELAHQSLIESWGYTVEIIDDDATQAEFDAAVANNDVVFTTNDITASRLGTKVVDATIGVVTSEDNLSDEFGLASTIGWESGTVLEINDNTHYVTSPFSTGVLTILTSNESLAYVSGTLSPELGKLASSSSGFGIVTLEAGAAMYGGGTAAGRRAQLPWGGTAFDPNTLNADGLTLLQRALEWGAGAGGASIDVQVADGNDDAEELSSDGTMYLTSTDLELADNLAATGQPTDIVGIRFTGVAIPPGTSVTNAYIQFQVDEVDSGAASLTIKAEATDDAAQFTTADFDLSSRPRTTASALWAPPDWTTIGEQGVDQRTVDISAVIQEVIDRPGWASGNALVVIVSGSGVRTAEAFDGEPAGAPTLHVEYGGSAADASAGGLIAHWKLDESSGNIATDSVGGHHGTLVNGPVWVSGHLDGGLSLDGNNDYVDVSSLNPATYDDFTVSAWYKSAGSGVSDDEYIFEHNENFSNEVTFGPTDDGTGDRLRFGFAHGGSGTWDPHYGTSDVVDQDWHHLVGVRDSGRIRIYVDGVLESDGADAHAGQSITIDGDGPFIGDLPGNTEQVHGIVDDVRLYDRALTTSEISILFSAGSGGGGTGGACDGTFRDEFNAESYGNNDGTLSWSTNWVEINESDGWDSGDERVRNDDSNFHLQVRDNDGGGEGVQREADLSANLVATFSFDYRRDGFDNSNDYVTVDVSSNGGSTWTELDRFSGPGTDSSYTAVSYDISGHISTATRIRFLTSSNLGGGDELNIDNVEIAVSGCAN